jgi:hypothetical protein
MSDVPRTRLPKSRNYCFTLNNYTDEHVNRIIAGDPRFKYIIAGREVGENGTPHLQGTICAKTTMLLSTVKNWLGGNAHFESTRDVSASIKYCEKDGSVIEFGTRPMPRPGSRLDLDQFKEDVQSGRIKTITAVRHEHSLIYARYRQFAVEYLDDYKVAPLPVVKYALRKWQAQLITLLRRTPDDRKINFVVDDVGHSGKTWFAKYYCELHSKTSQVLTPGKKADMAMLLETTSRVVFMDAPRFKTASDSDHLQYDFLEEMKNGLIFCPKYHTKQIRMNPPHVVVFTNAMPNFSALSADRFNVIVINNQNNVHDKEYNATVLIPDDTTIDVIDVDHNEA